MIYKNIWTFITLTIVTSLLILSVYQLFTATLQSRLHQELSSWQGRHITSAHYVHWLKKKPMVDLLVSLSVFNGQALQSASRFYRLGSRLSVLTDQSQVYR